MGNKFSIGEYVIYCGFPAQRRRFKQREEEIRRQQEAKEAVEAFQRAEKFKADYPEYCQMAGIGTSKTVTQPDKVEVVNRNRNMNNGWSDGIDEKNK